MAEMNDTFRLEYIEADVIRLIPIQKQENKMQFKPSIVLAFAGWVSVFTLCWLLLLGVVEKSWLSAFMLIFFFIVAFFASFAQQIWGKPSKTMTITKVEK